MNKGLETPTDCYFYPTFNSLCFDPLVSRTKHPIGTLLFLLILFFVINCVSKFAPLTPFLTSLRDHEFWKVRDSEFLVKGTSIISKVILCSLEKMVYTRSLLSPRSFNHYIFYYFSIASLSVNIFCNAFCPTNRSYEKLFNNLDQDYRQGNREEELLNTIDAEHYKY